MSTELGIGIVALVVAGWGLVAALLARFSISSALSFVVIGAQLGDDSPEFLGDEEPHKKGAMWTVHPGHAEDELHKSESS